MNHMTISSTNPTRFIEDALFCSDPFALSYSDPDQKWIIRQHLISLLQDFPSLKPSVAVFTHNDGTDVKLLLAAGHLPVSPPVPLTIWVHELYPHVPPIVYVNAAAEHYPFTDPAAGGAAATAYIASWHFSRSSLSGLAHNLARLFCYNHPSCDRWAHPSLASRMEATDRLACSLCCDAAAVAAGARREIEDLAAVQAKLKERSKVLTVIMSELEGERRSLKSRSGEMCEEVDRLQNWLKENAAGGGGADEAFEGVDEWSEAAVDALAADMAAEDLMYKLEKAVGEGVVTFDVYMKQVRVLAREQYFHRAKLEKIRSSFQL